VLFLFGLGNPGERYADNRHNIGFMAVDDIAHRHGFSPWRVKFQSHIAEGNIAGVKVLAVKPQTFMNRSGQAVGEVMRFYKAAPEDIIVLHDEIDLMPGKIRVKTGGGHGGNNGVRDIIAHIGADFTRVRLGVGHPGEQQMVERHVLSDFAKADDEWLDPLLEAVAKSTDLLVAKSFEKFMTQVALQTQPDKPVVNKSKEAGNNGV
jgi:PTH1 family peptidyl-tRNA hydrolase